MRWRESIAVLRRILKLNVLYCPFRAPTPIWRNAALPLGDCRFRQATADDSQYDEFLPLRECDV
jgi:hypothetical protein